MSGRWVHEVLCTWIVQRMLNGVGVVLYVMMVGKLPFQERTLSRLVCKIVSGTYELSKSLSPTLRDLLQRMLKPNPGKRIQLIDIVKHPWVTSGNSRHPRDTDFDNRRVARCKERRCREEK